MYADDLFRRHDAPAVLPAVHELKTVKSGEG